MPSLLSAYSWKAGFVVRSILERHKQSLVAKAFATHPVTEDRIRRAQEEISVLTDKTEYVVDTSEFQDIKARLGQFDFRECAGGAASPQSRSRHSGWRPENCACQN